MWNLKFWKSLVRIRLKFWNHATDFDEEGGKWESIGPPKSPTPYGE